MPSDSAYRQRIQSVVLDSDTFISATFSGRRANEALPWIKVTLRPVMVKGRRHIQFSYFDARKDITKNYAGQEAVEKLDELLDMGFSSVSVQTTGGNLQVQITRKGRVIVHGHKASSPQPSPDLAHDRRKHHALPADQPNAFLQAVGIMSADGRVKAHMQDKFTQINEFLKIVSHTDDLHRMKEHAPLYVVDCGCGKAYLTFAIYHYLNEALGVPACVTGVDLNESLLATHAARVQALGWDKLRFEAGSIIDFQPEAAPDVVLALHACDTATDEALAQAIRWGSKLIFSAPCCHHHLQEQLESQPAPVPFKPVLRHGILRERLGDILTDALRALILRVMGYRTEVIQFVATEHTAKNLMIRAVKTARPGERKFIEEYIALKSFWGVTPYLETLLGEQLEQLTTRG